MKHSINCSNILKIFLLTLISVTAFGSAAKKPWTLLVYMAADNNLYEFSDYNIRQMMRIGSNEYINIVIYLCKHPSGQQKVAQKIIVNKNSTQIVGQELNVDSGSPQSLIKACTWAFEEFPSDHVAVVCWDHGSGPLNRMQVRGVCYDDTTGNYLTDLDLQAAFGHVCKNSLHGKRIDIVSFDACLMASCEIYYTLQDYVDYVVASEETVPGTGMDYTRALASFLRSSVTPDLLSRMWVAAFRQTYMFSTQSYTLSAIKLANLELVIKNLESIATQLTDLLNKQTSTSVRSVIRYCADPLHCTTFEDRDLIDLDDFYNNLLNKVDTITTTMGAQQTGIAINTLKQTLMNGRALIKQLVIASVAGRSFKNAAGVSIYFPHAYIHSSYYKLDWSLKHPQWLNLLKTYHRIR